MVVVVAAILMYFKIFHFRILQDEFDVVPMMASVVCIGAWQGEEIELDHRDRDESSTGAAAIVTAVDLERDIRQSMKKSFQF